MLIAAGLRGPQGARARASTVEAVGEDLAGARLAGGHRLSRQRPACRPISTRSASTSSATAAPPASAIPARCPTAISEAISENDLVAASVLSGNRNFEGRVNPDVRANYLASPPLVVAYALAGSMQRRPRPPSRSAPASDGKPVYLQATSGRPTKEIAEIVAQGRSRRRCSSRATPTSSRATRTGRAIAVEGGETYGWDGGSTYVQNPPYFEGMTHDARAGHRHRRTRASSACSSTRSPPTTSRPAGSIKARQPGRRSI